MPSPCASDPSKCACTYLSCSRRGKCCACVSHHLGKDEVPGCFFTPEGERSYDRSRGSYLRDCQRRLPV